MYAVLAADEAICGINAPIVWILPLAIAIYCRFTGKTVGGLSNRRWLLMAAGMFLLNFAVLFASSYGEGCPPVKILPLENFLIQEFKSAGQRPLTTGSMIV